MIDLALIEQCKNPNVPTYIIEQIIKVESDSKELALNVNEIGKLTPKTKDEAIKTAKEYITKGYSVDMGLMQFNSKNLSLPAFSHYSVSDMFEPCKNIKAGSDIFYLAYEATNSALNKKDRISRALSIYNTGNQKDGFSNGYVKKYSSLGIDWQDDFYKAARSATKLNLTLNLYKFKDNKYTKEGAKND